MENNSKPEFLLLLNLALKQVESFALIRRKCYVDIFEFDP